IRYKPHLRVEFAGLCVYCRVSEKTRHAFDEYSVDHYRPKSIPRFAHLECDYSNLYYCCPACNRRKGTYWPKAAKESSEFIPNPCDHEMFEHMAQRDGVVVAKTEAGTKACEVLRLNEDRFVRWRKAILRSIEKFESCVEALTRQRAEAQRKLA